MATRGVYRLVRHPLYLFSLMALWSSPVMTEPGLGLALGATIYFRSARSSGEWGEGDLRFSYACSLDNIQEALRRIRSCLAK